MALLEADQLPVGQSTEVQTPLGHLRVRGAALPDASPAPAPATNLRSIVPVMTAIPAHATVWGEHELDLGEDLEHVASVMVTPIGDLPPGVALAGAYASGPRAVRIGLANVTPDELNAHASLQVRVLP